MLLKKNDQMLQLIKLELYMIIVDVYCVYVNKYVYIYM